MRFENIWVKYLGEGGMSAVYAAFDKVIRREVALKILHRDLLLRGKGSLLRFQREAQALGNLDHPNIVKIHHFDADENAQPFIVMDIVQGEPLARRIVKNLESIKFDDIVDIFVQVCDALAHAHERGVVHRDLKPSNIMVVGNTVKVLDFGIAKLVSEDSDQELQLTRTGEVFGSPLYMSPEQCRGMKLDVRSDIYSIGCVMFEAFTGSPPFTGNSHIDTMLKHVNDLPPSVASSMTDPRFADKVDAILLRCLAKKPADRYQSMSEIKDALLTLDQEVRGGLLAKVRRQFELARLKLGAQERLTKKMIVGYSAAAIVFAGLGATAFVQHQNSSAVTFITSFKDANFAHWKELDQSGQLEFDSGNFAKAESLFRSDLAMAQQMKKPELAIISLNQLVDLYVAKAFLDPTLKQNQSYCDALDSLRKQVASIQLEQNRDIQSLMSDLSKADSMSVLERTELLNRSLDVAQSLNAAGLEKDCLALLDSVLALKSTSADKAILGRAHYLKGRCFDDMRELKKARDEYSLSLKYREEVLQPNDVEIARSLGCLALVTEDRQVQKELLQRAHGIISKSFDANSHQAGWANALLAVYYNEIGEKGAAKQKAETAIRQCESALQKELSLEEQARAKGTLVRMLLLRAELNYDSIMRDVRKDGSAANQSAREAAVKNDRDQAYELVEQINPKTSVKVIDTQLAGLLLHEGSQDKSAWEKSRSPLDILHLSEPETLKRAQAKLARSLSINSRYDDDIANKRSAGAYIELGKIAKRTSNLDAAKRYFGEGKTLSDRAFGKNSKESKDFATELAILNR